GQNRNKPGSAGIAQRQWLPFFNLRNNNMLVQEGIDWVEHLPPSNRIEKRRRQRKNRRQYQSSTRNGIQTIRNERPRLKFEKRAQHADSQHHKPEKKRTVAIDPEQEQDRQRPEPSRIAAAPKMQQHQLRDQQQIADHLLAHIQVHRREKPHHQRARERHLGIARVHLAKPISGDKQRGGKSPEPQHQPGIAAQLIGHIDRRFRKPLLGHGRHMVGRVGILVRYRNRVGRPDDLPIPQMPPHIGVIKAAAHRKKRQHSQQEAQKYGK